MPIYEFYCADCNTLFNFFTASPTQRQPACPRCQRRELPRRPSRFATLKYRGEEEPDLLAGLDEAKLEGAMDSLLGEMGELDGNEEDPRAMARLMRRFSDLTGLEMGDRMEDFMVRLEAGEDPESLEQEMDGEMGEEEMDDFFHLKKALQERRARPRVDEELHFF